MDSDIKFINDDDSASQKASHVVIRTLKERCCILQRRLKVLEEENLRLSIQNNKLNEDDKHYNIDEISELKANIVQLTKEKAQVTQHAFMLVNENKKLWSRLSSISHSRHATDHEKSTETYQPSTKSAISNVDSQFTVPHLIRSQTFTQTSPNPKLKAKIEEKQENIEASLEEISLKVLNSFLAEKTELVQQYEQMAEFQMMNDDFSTGFVPFLYLDDINCDSLADIKNYTEKLVEMKKELLQQQVDLKNFINHLELIKTDDKLNASNETKNIQEVLKENIKSECLDTSETEILDSSTRWVTPANSTSYHDNIDDVSSFSHNTSKITQSNLQNSVSTSNKLKDDESKSCSALKTKEEKKIDKICPICGEHFKPSVPFEKFTQHVEDHFVGEEEFDSLAENYEVVVNSVGNNFN